MEEARGQVEEEEGQMEEVEGQVEEERGQVDRRWMDGRSGGIKDNNFNKAGGWKDGR